MWLFCEGVSLPCRDFLRFPQVELVLKDMRWRAEASHLRATAASVKICQLPLSSRSRVIDWHAQEGSFPASREYRELQPFIARLAVVADGKQCAGTLLEVKPCAMDRPLLFCRLSTCAHIWLDAGLLRRCCSHCWILTTPQVVPVAVASSQIGQEDIFSHQDVHLHGLDKLGDVFAFLWRRLQGEIAFVRSTSLGDSCLRAYRLAGKIPGHPSSSCHRRPT